MDVAGPVLLATGDSLARGQTDSAGPGQPRLGSERERLGLALAARGLRRDLGILQAGRRPKVVSFDLLFTEPSV